MDFMDYSNSSDYDYLTMQQNFLPESPETPPFGPPSGLPESPDTPSWGPPSGLPESPDTPSWGPPSGLPESPDTPSWGPPIILPTPPSPPNRPVGQRSTLRFLYAATNQPPVNIYVDRRNVATNFQYSNITGYNTVSSGLLEITIRNARNNSEILNQTSFLLSNGGVYTVALINAPNGLVLYLIEDTACYKNLNDSCFRVANLSYQSPPIDILLGNGQLLFKNIRYMDLTEYRQIRPGTYPFLAVESRSCGLPLYDTNRAVQVVPIVIGANIRSCYGRILLSSLMPFNRNRIYTIYLIGRTNGRPPLQFLLTENYLEY